MPYPHRIEDRPDKQLMVIVRAWDDNQEYEVLVDEADYWRWRGGQLIQYAFPDMSLDHRELLISGTSPGGFDSLFEEPDDVAGM